MLENDVIGSLQPISMYQKSTPNEVTINEILQDFQFLYRNIIYFEHMMLHVVAIITLIYLSKINQYFYE